MLCHAKCHAFVSHNPHLETRQDRNKTEGCAREELESMNKGPSGRYKLRAQIRNQHPCGLENGHLRKSMEAAPLSSIHSFAMHHQDKPRLLFAFVETDPLPYVQIDARSHPLPNIPEPSALKNSALHTVCPNFVLMSKSSPLSIFLTSPPTRSQTIVQISLKPL